MLLRTTLASLLAAMGAAAAAQERPAELSASSVGPPPANLKNYEQRILAQLSKLRLHDPYSAKVLITRDPAPIEHVISAYPPAVVFRGYAACGRINAKNLYGGYTGEKDYIFLLYSNGEVGFAGADGLSESRASYDAFCPAGEPGRLIGPDQAAP